jgi:hypothetical protein
MKTTIQVVAVILAISGFAHETAAACPYPSIISTKNDPNDYVRALVDSYGLAQSALSRTSKETDRTTNHTTFDQIDLLKLAKTDYECAAEAVNGFRKSKDEAIKASAEGAHLVYSALKQLNESGISELQKLAALNPKKVDVPAIVERLSDIDAKTNEVWRTLAEATTAATHALVQKDERLSTLKLTSNQRQTISDELVGKFGDEIKGGLRVGQIPLIASAALLYQFVEDKNWKSSDSK